MTGAPQDALGWAVAQWHAPELRHALRARPLPPDLGALLAVAAGMREAVSEASRRTGQPDRVVVELVRFALREQLFFPAADAYRTLGLNADGAPAALRAHHRLLQQWLHPDRCDGDDAVFAARVNAAWDRLRTEERRQSYAAALSTERAAATGGQPPPAAVLWGQAWVPESRSERWRRRAPLVALSVACVGLGTLAIIDQSRAPPRNALVASGEAGDDDFLSVWSAKSAKSAQASAPRVGNPAPPRTRQELPAPPPYSAQPPLPPPAARAEPVTTSGAVAASDPSLRAESVVRADLAASNASVVTRQPDRAASPETRLASPPARAETAAPEAAESRLSAAGLAPAAPDATRVQAAQQAGDRLLAYLGGKGARVPPIWDSLGTQQAAGQMRESLLASQGAMLASPDWRVGGEAASLQAGVRYADGREGRVRARLVWREQRWLVSDVAMERDW
jgi:hypothetical protein